MVTPKSCYVPTSPAKSSLSWQDIYRMCAGYYPGYSGPQELDPWPAVAGHDKFVTTGHCIKSRKVVKSQHLKFPVLM